ncbi:hypothetical protein PGTUg99_010976 [Puccinia graminis f. sp. tritici]|uniref:Uncharacterized protein n=1 Tax=Puccinia graminis f. sp. tritici TaxID=56615 RepID=A0A5B0R4W0_PUCGR|nr:hypothetical protein PGTUg99_010976 [Puccinia graminis f. sp. tritici]
MASVYPEKNQPIDVLQPSPSVVDGPHPNPLISAGASPSSLDDKTMKIIAGSLESPLMDIQDKSDPLHLSDQSLSKSLQDLNLSPVLPPQGLETNVQTDSTIPDNGVEIIPLHDDPGCPIVTLRSVLVGVFLSALGASVTQIAAFIIGRSCELIPGPQWWNPGAFSLKETGFAALMAAAAGVATVPAEMIAVYELYFGQVINFGVALGILVGAQLLAYGWAGLLQPILIYPSRAVYP